MAFKIKARDVSNIRKDIKKKAERKTSGPRWATNIPAEGNDLLVRFMANPDNGWVQYEEVYDLAANKYFVVLEENEEEFRERGLRPSVRYYAPALDISKNEPIVLKLPYSLVERLTMIADKKGAGDITNLDISLYKTGTGTDTKYFADPEGRSDIDLSIHKIPSLWDLLESRVREEQNISDDDDELEDEEIQAEVEEAVEENVPTAEEAPKSVKRIVRRAVKK